MLRALLAAIPLLLAQESESIPPTPYDRVIELEITADDEPAIEGRGPTVFAEYQVEFDGTLHIWTRSELDLFLQVDDAAEARPLASDDNSGGGTTPYVSLDVEPGAWLAILVAGAPGSTGPMSLHLVAAPETEATRAAAAAARGAVREARRLLREGDRASARDLVEGVLADIEDSAEAGTSEEIHDALFDIGVFGFNEMRSLRESREVFEPAARHRERTLPVDHPELLDARLSLAGAMRATGDLAGARALGESVLAAFERRLPADHPDILQARGNLAVSMFEMGDLAGARALRESVLVAYERSLPADHRDLLRARAHLASSIAAMGDLAAGRALRESVLAGYERSLPADHPNLLLARGNLAVSMHEMGDLAGVRALCESVFAAYERSLPADHPDLLRAQANLASSMAAMGDLAEARALRESALTALERRLPSDHPDLLSARANLASSMGAMGDLAEARALHESVLAGYERCLPADHPNLLLARANLASSMHVMGDLAGARALLLAQVSGMRMRILGSLALAPRQARQTVASESYRHAEVLFLSESARSDLERIAFELTETLRLVAAEAARSLARFETDPELAPILQEAGKIRRALNDLVAGATRDETGSEELSAELTRLSLKRDALEREASRRLAERGVVTKPVSVSALAAALAPGDVTIGYRRIAIKHLDPSSGEIQPAASHVLAHVLDSDGKLSRIDLGPASELEQLATDWRAALGAPILRRAPFLRARLAPDLDQLASVPVDSRGISTLAGVGLTADKHGESAVGGMLRARILDPILALVGDDAERLFVCADDLLFLLPLDALPGDGSSARVGDRYQIVNGVSFARLLARARPSQAAPSLLAFGGVDYDAQGAVPEGLVASSAPIEATESVDDVEPGADDQETGSPDGRPESRSALPGRFQSLLQARYEAEATANLFEEAFEIEPALLTKTKTTKAALFESAAGKRYVHIATHGWFAPECVRSTEDAHPEGDGFARMGVEERVSGLAPMTLCGLALAGANKGRDSLGRVPGILTAEELCSLDLSQCELAVLSACETNVGIRRAGQGIQSLQSALYAAGARTSITSLWKVDDAATRRLMKVFYTNLWIENLPKAEALWQAKQALRDEGHPPAHWAGWVLTGDPE